MELSEIEYEYFQEAARHLQSLEYVLPDIDVVGMSNGGSLGIWLAAVEDEVRIRKVAALSASHHFIYPAQWKGDTP